MRDAVKEAEECLPSERLAEVLDFVSFLLAKEEISGDEKERKELASQECLILRYYIGG